jgi:PAS domain S-box-containing protein
MSAKSDPFTSSEGERTLFEAMPQLGWVAEADGRVNCFNRRWYDYTGKTPQQMDGLGWTSVHDPALLPEILERTSAAIAIGQPFEMSFPLRRHDGVFRWFKTYAAPLRDERGVLLRWVGVTADIDDQKRAEQALIEAVKRRESLLAIVSHDLRNPLNTVLLAATQIERFADESELGLRTKKAAHHVIRAVGQMSRLVGDLLDTAKLEAKQPLTIDPERHDVIELAREASDAAEEIVQARKLTLETQLPDEPVYAMCDADRIQQVFGNLVGNAVKFTREGGHIRIGARRANDELTFFVSDTGTGITEDQLVHVFETYWQVESPQNGGAGLGLSIVKAIVEAHAGRVWVETTVDRGSTFYFTLPTMSATSATKEQK